MRKAVLTFILLARLLSALTLRSEAEEFLSGLAARGFTGTGLAMLELSLLESCTLSVYPPTVFEEGFVIGMGGNNILDLHLRVEGEGWFLEDTMPDDLPVIRMVPADTTGSFYLLVCARDMLRGARSDSAAVMWAFSPVDPEAE